MPLKHRLDLSKKVTVTGLCDALASECLVNTKENYLLDVITGAAAKDLVEKQIRLDTLKEQAGKVYIELNDKKRVLDALELKIPKVNKDFSDIVNLTPQVRRLTLELQQKERAVLTALWGLATATVVSEGTLDGLRAALTATMSEQGKWSLQILPDSLGRVGHHMALKRLEKAVNLIDPATAVYIYDEVAETVEAALDLLLRGGFTGTSRYVLLKIT